jgi:hypothetical protein
MFNLEQSIADWRKQMLAAGIKTPVPLEELEIHLREEIERQMKSDAGEQQAFEISAKQIGRSKFLKHEFQKIERKNMKRALMLTVGWLAACFIMFASLMQMDFALNLFDWHPEWDWRIPIFGACVLASITMIWFLAKVTHDRFSFIASMIMCLALLCIAVGFIPPEKPEPATVTGILAGFFLRHTPSPWWFRGSIAVCLTLPAALWFGWQLRHRRHSLPNSVRESRVNAS